MGMKLNWKEKKKIKKNPRILDFFQILEKFFLLGYLHNISFWRIALFVNILWKGILD